MRYRLQFVSIFVLVVLCACGGGDSTAGTKILPPANVVDPSGQTRSVQLGLKPTSATLPVIAQITGTVVFPAANIPATISLSASATSPAGVALEKVRRAQSGTLTVFEYFTIVSPVTVSLPSIPAITLWFPASTPLADRSVYYGISDLNAQGGLVSFNTQGPGTLSGHTVSFAKISAALTFEAGHKYTFVVFATSNARAVKIYVTNEYNNTLTTYNADGTQTTPTITAGLQVPVGVAIDAAGKIYVANDGTGSDTGTVTTYNADGTRTTPTIRSGLAGPIGVAVDAAGKIYVANFNGNSVTTYKADGTRTTPTITAGLNGPAFLAVDRAGKIYVTNYTGNTVTTYNADGSNSTPTISAGIGTPEGILVDEAGKIYVANFNGSYVATYSVDGIRTNLTISAGVDLPDGLAIDTAGKIYVANNGNQGHEGGVLGTVSTYEADGTRTEPTITDINGVFGIAVR